MSAHVADGDDSFDERMDVAEVYRDELINYEKEAEMIAEIKAEDYKMGVKEDGEEEMQYDWAWDGFKDKPLDLQKVRNMKSKGLWEEADIEECFEKTRKNPVTVKWVDTDKGIDRVSKIRCRLVAREFRTKGEKDREDLFAATPPLEMLRLLMSKAATVTPRGT